MNTEKDEGTFADFMEAKPKTRSVWKWVEGVVDSRDDHIKLWHGKPPTEDRGGAVHESGRPVALVTWGRGKTFRVQFLLTARPTDKRAVKILKDVRRELDFYLLQVGGPNPWAYAQYHCSTAANLYSKVHWTWCPKAAKRVGSKRR